MKTLESIALYSIEVTANRYPPYHDQTIESFRSAASFSYLPNARRVMQTLFEWMMTLIFVTLLISFWSNCVDISEV